MTIKNIISALFITSCALQASAQYAEDAFRFSGAENSSSARLNGLGGQQTSLGGDLSSLYGNPAGLGMFSKSEFAFTTSFINNSNSADFLGNSQKSSFSNPNINNIGVVFHSPVAKTGDLKHGLLSVNFGLGYQKTNFFRNELDFNGESNLNGLSDYFLEDANGPNNLNNNLTNAAFNGGLILDDPANAGYYINNTKATSTQTETITRKGGQSNFDLSLGLNFSNNFYLGFGLGIASINYRSEELLKDEGDYEDNSQPYTANLLYSYDTKGSGVNFKVGAIFKPINELRLGLSLETPTYYNLDDNYYEELAVDYNGGRVNDNNSYPVNYDLRTPLKLNGGISYIIGNKGLITADISYRDYSMTHFSSDIGDNITDMNVNNQLKQNYKEVVNYGLGAEFKVAPAVALRAGYRYIADPNVGLDADYALDKYSGGVGYRFGNSYIDAALSIYDINSNYSAYRLSNGNQPVANITDKVANVSLTFGTRF